MRSDTPGVHHVSAIGGDPQRNAAFDVAGSGLRPLVRTVNFEDEFTHHLYGADAGRTLSPTPPNRGRSRGRLSSSGVATR
ncbi:hypothetical protein [Haloarcula pellucida]|uniref:Uncharacterized protein n=1 Tax=Haloarcula pellucida TaxID=1427151 RepID=A0A830GTH2_9EURY|nr:hypothetical protein [Halomicroarcula pellucida]MBX0350256.1 hypothetical protein [Halomicroarcula pellucida]GGO01187.1 hypothetical protein GCM10009030_34580 [Halomicroarcula pellucida]